MTTHELCTFRLDGHLFGVPVAAVQEVMRDLDTPPVPMAPPDIVGLANLRGQVVTALDGRTRLQLPPRGPDQGAMKIVIHAEGDTVALLVDEIGEVMTVDDAAFEAAPPTLAPALRTLIRGAFALDRELLLLLDTTQALAPRAA